MSHINLLEQSAPYTPSDPSKTGRLDVTWSGGIGSVDYGTITTKGGGRRRHRKTRGRKSRRRQTRKAKRLTKGSK
jgi:hypothetical protein